MGASGETCTNLFRYRLRRRMYRITLLAVAFVIAAIGNTPEATAQRPFPRGTNNVEAAVPGYYYVQQPGDRTVTVMAVGNVGPSGQNAGQYTVSLGTTLAGLLAYTGGVAPDRRGTATIRLYRSGARAVETQITSLYQEGAAPVVLREGDVIEVVGLTSSVPGYYVHTEPGSDPISVTAAGAFAASGLYLVGPSTTVGDLVALAGGTGALGEREARTEVTATIRLFRNGAAIFQSPLEEIYARPTQPLQVGDVVDLQVTYSRREPILRDVVSIIGVAVSIGLLLERIFN